MRACVRVHTRASVRGRELRTVCVSACVSLSDAGPRREREAMADLAQRGKFKLHAVTAKKKNLAITLLVYYFSYLS